MMMMMLLLMMMMVTKMLVFLKSAKKYARFSGISWRWRWWYGDGGGQWPVVTGCCWWPWWGGEPAGHHSTWERGGVRRRKKKEEEGEGRGKEEGGEGEEGREKKKMWEEEEGGEWKGSCGRECFENLGAPHFDISYLFIINVNVFLNAIKKVGGCGAAACGRAVNLWAPHADNFYCGWNPQLSPESMAPPTLLLLEETIIRTSTLPHRIPIHKILYLERTILLPNLCHWLHGISHF